MKVTKQQALDAFINERVLGDKPFAFNPTIGMCQYRHEINGGCAVGQHLPSDLCVQLDGLASGSYNRVVGQFYQEFDEALEDFRSSFWGSLQMAHDNLALMYRNNHIPSSEWENTSTVMQGWVDFETNLKAAVYYAEHTV